MTLLREDIYAVEVPEGAESCELRGAHPQRPYPLLSFYGEGEAVELPPGDYEILVFNTDTVTEVQARIIVGEGQYDGRACYEIWAPYGLDDPYESATAALSGLLASRRLDKPNYAILKKVG